MLRGSLILSQQQLWKEGSFLVFSPAQKRPPLQWSMKGMLKNNEQEKHGGNPKRVWFVFLKRFFPPAELQNFGGRRCTDVRGSTFFSLLQRRIIKNAKPKPFQRLVRILTYFF